MKDIKLLKKIVSFTRSHSRLHKGTKWAVPFLLGFGVAVFPYQYVSSHPDPEENRIPLGDAEEITVMPAQKLQQSYIYYPKLDVVGLQEAFEVNVPTFEKVPSLGSSAVNVTAYHLVVPRSGYSLESLTRQENRSAILFFSEPGKLMLAGREYQFSAKSYAVIPKRHISKLQTIASTNNRDFTHVKFFLTDAPYDELKDEVNAIPFSTDEWKTPLNAVRDIEAYNAGWTTSLDSTSGSMGIVCSEDLMTDNPTQRASIYKQEPLLRRFPQYVEEEVENGAYELELDGSNLYIKNFGVINVADIGITEDNIHQWAITILPPHHHDAAEIYTGYEGHIFMRLGNNLIEMPKGALVWVPNNVVHGYVGFFKEDEDQVGCFPYVFPQGRFSYEGFDYIYFDELSDIADPQKVYTD
ncbi:MAG: hypothetical protein F6K26_08050 [Moorea sp. SIO2I5]|nr:hypothetical protein [Moorena sp. SIO2I5]